MLLEERDPAYLWDMLDAAKDVVEIMTFVQPARHCAG